MRVKVPDTAANYDECICYQGCPTYDRNRLTGGLFCASGKSEKSIQEYECICPSCPVQARFNLSGLFYCKKGAAD